MDSLHAEELNENEWQDHLPHSRHAEMLRQDRNRLLFAGVGGTIVALALIGGAYAWTSTMRAHVAFDGPPAETSSEQKLKALAPHEALVISQTPSPDAIKKVRSERIGTNVD